MIIEKNSLEEYCTIFNKQKVKIILFTFMCVALISLITFAQPDIYEASCYLLVDTDSPNVLGVKDVVTLGETDYRSYQEYLLTQIELLQRRPIAQEAYNKLKLGERLTENENPEPPSYFSKDYFKYFLKKVKTRIKSLFISPLAPDGSNRLFWGDINDFQKIISVGNIKDTRLLKISFQDENPDLAKEIVNEIGKIFVAKNLERKVDTTKEASKWLAQKIESLKTNLKEKQDKIQLFKKENNLISPDERREIINQNLLELNKRYVEAGAVLASNKMKYRDEHPKMKQTIALLSSLKEMIAKTRDNAIQFEARLIEYNNLIQGVETSRILLENLLTRERETMMASTYFANNISIAEEAETPAEPIGPNRKLNIFLALLFGISGGFAWAYFKEMFNSTIQGSNDFLKYQIPFLGNVPYIKQSLFDKKNMRDSHILFNDKGIISEIFNHLRTSIILSTQSNVSERKNKSLLITSFLPGEGKTLIASNIAQSMAKYNFKTLLIDVDLRKSRLNKIFNTESKKGLSDYLLGVEKLSDVIVPGPMKNLDLLLNHTCPDNPSELLGSDTFKKMITKLEEYYEVIILDSPPVFAVTDPVLLSAIVKNVILVSTFKSTPKKFIPLIKEKYDASGAQIVGAIINKAEINKADLASNSSYYN